jgi:hypothetical protein
MQLIIYKNASLLSEMKAPPNFAWPRAIPQKTEYHVTAHSERMTGYSSLIGLGKNCRPNVPYARLGRECRTPTRTARRISDP